MYNSHMVSDNTTASKGISMAELLLAFSTLAIIISICIVASNPEKKLAMTRNSQRLSDTTVILQAVYQYSIDHNGNFPGGITKTPTEICKTGATDCKKLIDFSVVTNDNRYTARMPIDPKGSVSPNGTGYEVSRDSLGRITVSAPKAEYGEIVKVSR